MCNTFWPNIVDLDSRNTYASLRNPKLKFESMSYVVIMDVQRLKKRKNKEKRTSVSMHQRESESVLLVLIMGIHDAM
jgi:hypothetical protein